MRKILCAVGLSLIALIIIAIPVIAATYSATFTVSETTGLTSYTMLPVIKGSPNAWMAANGFINSDGRDVQVSFGSTATHRMLQEDYVLFSDDVTPYQSDAYSFSTNNTPDNFDIIAGYNGYITVADDADLEPSSNFTLTLADTWINTDNGTAKNLVSHYDATNGGLQWFVSPTTDGTIDYSQYLYKADFTTDNFSDTGTKIKVNTTTQRLEYESECSAVSNRTSYDLTAISDTNWKLEFTMKNTTTTASSLFGFGLWSSNSTQWFGYAGDSLFCQFSGGAVTYTAALSRYYGGASGASGTITLTNNVQYYLTLERNTAILATLSVFTDAARTTHTAGSPVTLVIPATITGLRYIIAQNYADNTGAAKELIGWVDDLVVNPLYLSAVGVASGEYDLYVGMASPFLKMSVDTSLILPVSSNLVMNIPLPEESCEGASFTSVDSNAYSLTVSGATYSPGVGRVFDGLNDFIYSSAAAIDFTAGDFTINLWLYIPTGAPGDRTIMSRGVDTTDGYFLYYSGTSRLQFYTCQAAAQQNTQSLTIDSFDMWHYYSIVRSGAVVTIYRDGVDYTFSHGAHVNPLTSARDLYLGRKDTVGQYMSMTLGDVEVYSIAFTPTQIIQNYQATLCTYNGSITEDIISTMTAVPNSTSDWTISQNDATTYIGSYKHYVGGSLIAWFEPNTMIIGSTLPDREPTGGSNDGTITWGSNPVGVSVELGPLMGEESVPSFIDDPDTQDVLPGAESSDWYVPPDIGVGGSLLTNPLRPFVLILSDTTTLTERQAWVLLGIAFVLLVLVITAKTVHGHHIITGIATGAAIGLCVVQTIFPFYSIIFIIASILVGAVAERSQSL